MKAVTMTSFGQYAVTDKAGPLKASGGDIGGGRRL